jgi:(E)-4-hydroxy-3-methylbut-2-enyl-diphosphate synthase
MAKKQIIVGGIPVGGGAPITVQSMTNTKTENAEQTASQINRLAENGCDIVRVAVPTMEAARAIEKIKQLVCVPIVADIHFDYKLAIAAAEAGADKIRINPGNIGDPDRVKAVVDVCRRKNLPIRIGVNGGSLEKDILAKYGGVTPMALLESAMGHVRLLNKFDFDDICISVKSSDVPLTIASYRLLSEKTDYPLHLGVTEAGGEYMGIIKSAAGIGTLLSEGIGDTIRVSLTADPEREAVAGVSLLKALNLRGGVNIISCPTCGRTKIDLISIAAQVEKRLQGCTKDITVAIMGCAVNGPGEAARADVGIAGGDGEGVVFQKGKILKKVPMDSLVDELMTLISQQN